MLLNFRFIAFTKVRAASRPFLLFAPGCRPWMDEICPTPNHAERHGRFMTRGKVKHSLGKVKHYVLSVANLIERTAHRKSQSLR
jgi:hypothetical protein